MKPSNYTERTVDVEGWQVHLTTHQLGDTFRTTADNVSPGAWLARTEGATREEAEEKALARARQLLGRTRRQAV
jgi:hypothetical protein